MFSFDDQMDLVRAWGDIALGCMTTAAQISTAMLGQCGTVFAPTNSVQATQPTSSTRVEVSPSGPRARCGSWYRTPERSPFEPTWFSMAWPLPYAASPLAVAGLQPINAPLQLDAWAKLLRLPGMPVAFAMPANPLNWSSPANWSSMAALPWMAGMNCASLVPSVPAPASSPPFAAYRSASGHAVAQVTFPNEVVAAVALPSSATSLLDTVFAWPRMTH